MEQKSLMLRLSVIMCAVLILGLIVYFSKKDSSERLSNNAVSVSEGAASFDPNAFELDTDSDGLRDWEESLWGTDLNTTDTDGDGTSDGEEVESGRDPLIAGPDDQIEAATTPSYKRTDIENLTTTQRFERDYYSGIAKLSAEGQLNNDTLQTFILGLTQEYVVDEQLEKQYTESDITITSDPSLSTLKDYSNRLGAVARVYAGIDFEKELETIQEVIQTNGASGRAELAAIIEDYSTAHTALLEVGTVPFALIESHLTILNGVSAVEVALTEMEANLQIDPLKSMINLSTYQQGVLLIVQGSQTLAEYLEGRNVTFTPDEPGSILLSE